MSRKKNQSFEERVKTSNDVVVAEETGLDDDFNNDAASEDLLEQAAKELGLPQAVAGNPRQAAEKFYSPDGESVAMAVQCQRLLRFIRVTRTSKYWLKLTLTQRRLIDGAYYMLKQLLGEEGPRGEPNTLRDALGDDFPVKLTGPMRDQTDIAYARRTGQFDESLLES